METVIFGTMFAGGGGVDIGLMAAGLTPAWAVEYDAQIADVYRRNLGDHMIVADVRTVDYAGLPRVDWLHASPSCVRASVANAGATEAVEDVEAAAAVVRAILAQKPQVFTLENVWAYRNFAAFRLILDALGDAGYMYDFDHVNAADYGVPQTRRRLLLRAVHGALLPPLPQPVLWVGWYEAIADLIDDLPDAQLAPWQMARLPAELRQSVLLCGQNARDDKRGGMTIVVADSPSFTITTGGKNSPMRAVLVGQGQYEGRLLMADGTEPSNTITGNGNQTGLRAIMIGSGNTNATVTERPRPGDRPSFTTLPAQLAGARLILGCRAVQLTPRCLARFQSFPDWYELPDKRTLANKIIGNAVPPMVMECIAQDFMGGKP